MQQYVRKVLVVAIVCALTSVAFAQDKASLKQTQQQLESEQNKAAKLEKTAKELGAELGSLRENMRSTAEALQESEAQLENLEEQLLELEEEARELRDNLVHNQQKLTGLLGLLTRLSRLPPEFAIAMPLPPEETIRSGLLLKSIVPAIQVEVEALNKDLDRNREVKKHIDDQVEQIQLVKADLDIKNKQLESLVSKKSSILKTVEADKSEARKTAKDLAKKAKDLQDLLAKFAARPKPKPETELATPKSKPSNKVKIKPLLSHLPSFAKSKGKILSPIQGKIVKKFGAKDKLGGRNRGISILAKGTQTVVAPFDGQIVYAGPFRTYGQLIIIEHADEYHSLLAGMSDVQRGVGDMVLAGEPIGKSGLVNSQPHPLYVELRHKGKPINPQPWLLAKK